MSDWTDPFRLTSSAMNLLFGTDRGEYYRATGAALGYRSRGVSVSTDVRAFYERHRAVELTTDFSVRGFLRDDTVAAVLFADELDVAGGRGTLAWFSGTDPSSWILTGALTGEAGWTGDRFASVGNDTYQRVDARLSVSHPLFLGLAGALEVGSGTSWGALPLQRSFFLGSSPSLRGFHANEHFGPTFWRARGEVATDFVAARLSLFSDVGWVGERDAFRLDDPLASVGLGASLLDGIVRVDIARAVRGSNRWKAHLYLDGLF
jgi:hemolysin activation/secretion protein